MLFSRSEAGEVVTFGDTAAVAAAVSLVPVVGDAVFGRLLVGFRWPLLVDFAEHGG